MIFFGRDADEDATHDANRTLYACQTVKCQCIPERMLCGEDGSIGNASSELKLMYRYQ